MPSWIEVAEPNRCMNSSRIRSRSFFVKITVSELMSPPCSLAISQSDGRAGRHQRPFGRFVGDQKGARSSSSSSSRVKEPTGSKNGDFAKIEKAGDDQQDDFGADDDHGGGD